MKCKEALKLYDETDRYTNLPLRARLHLLFCRKCKKEIQLIEKRLKEMQNSTPFMTDDMSQAIMAKIAMTQEFYKSRQSSWHWITAGLLMVGGFLTLTLTHLFYTIKANSGWGVVLPISLLFGVIITIYPILYTATHIDTLKKLFHVSDKNVK